jgi:hypothetical protein
LPKATTLVVSVPALVVPLVPAMVLKLTSSRPRVRAI